ncbi:MAG: hypothetical protein KC486_02180 [Myxococcales bacterium]|nr:hypothetical protein [Myxococcales bacterium]
MLTNGRAPIRWRLTPMIAVGGFALAVALGLSCKPRYAATEPVKGASDACCKVTNEEMTKFAGCRMTHRCGDDERIWMRGHINCSPVEEERCVGGRCCEYQPLYGTPDAVLNWDAEPDAKDKAKAAGGDTDAEAPATPAADEAPAGGDAADAPTATGEEAAADGAGA